MGPPSTHMPRGNEAMRHSMQASANPFRSEQLADDADYLDEGAAAAFWFQGVSGEFDGEDQRALQSELGKRNAKLRDDVHIGALDSSTSSNSRRQRNRLLDTTDIRSRYTSEEAVPDHLICPITRQLFQDPVVASDGRTYERTAIQRVLDSDNPVSPISRQALSQLLVSNRAIVDAIENWKNSSQVPLPPDEVVEAFDWNLASDILISDDSSRFLPCDDPSVVPTSCLQMSSASSSLSSAIPVDTATAILVPQTPSSSSSSASTAPLSPKAMRALRCALYTNPRVVDLTDDEERRDA